MSNLLGMTSHLIEGFSRAIVEYLLVFVSFLKHNFVLFHEHNVSYIVPLKKKELLKKL